LAGRRAADELSRRDEILAVAADLFARKGFAGTTVRDIADAVGILSGSLYHHFNAKEDMVEEIFIAYFDDLSERWDAILAERRDARSTFEAMVRVALVNVDRHTAAARLSAHEWVELRHLADLDARWKKIEQLWLGVVRAGVSDGSFRSDVDPMLLFSVTMDMIRGLAGWYHPGHQYSIDALSDAYIGVLMTGTAARPVKSTRRPPPTSVRGVR